MGITIPGKIEIKPATGRTVAYHSPHACGGTACGATAWVLPAVPGT